MHLIRSISIRVVICCFVLLTKSTPSSAQDLSAYQSTTGLANEVIVALITFLLLFVGFIVYLYRESIFKLSILSYTTKSSNGVDPEDQNELPNFETRIRPEESRKDLITNISHELRTPLSMMLGPIDSLLENNELSEKETKLLRVARKNGGEMLSLVNSILTLSKLEAGKGKLNERTVDLFTYSRRVVSSFESYAERSHVQFLFDYQASKKLYLKIDTDKLSLVLNNLICNALKFTPEGGKVQVRVEDLFNKIKFSITDSGYGIPSEDIPHLFDRFYQSPYVKSKVSGGTGIGLAIVKQCVNLLEGKVEVNSELYQGTTFTVFLNRKEILTTQGVQLEETESFPESDNTGDERMSKTFNPSEPLKNKQLNNLKLKADRNTILLVEDNYSIRDFLKNILSEYFNIVAAKNGREGLDYLNSLDDLDNVVILSDIMMPVMDGYQFVEELKSDDRFKHIPVIMLTARADSESKLRALSLGANDYLLKPFEEKELKIKLHNLFRNHNNGKPSNMPNKNDSSKKILSEEDELWLKDFDELLDENLEKDILSVSWLAQKCMMSESTLRRQVKRITGLSPIKYVQELRLKQALKMLQERQYNSVSKVAYKVGYKDLSTFSKLFKSRFGKSPTRILKT